MVVGTMCIPEGDDVQELLTALFDNLDDNLNFGKYIADFQLCWKAIVGMCGLSFFIAFQSKDSTAGKPVGEKEFEDIDEDKERNEVMKRMRIFDFIDSFISFY